MPIPRIKAAVEYLANPFTYRAPDGTLKKLTLTEKIKAIAVLILFGPLGPLLFYLYTDRLKKAHIQVLSGSRIPAEKSALERRQSLGQWIPAIDRLCKEIDPLYTRLEGLLKTLTASDETAKRAGIEEAVPLLKQLTSNLQTIEGCVKNFLEKTVTCGYSEVRKAQEELKPLAEKIGEIPYLLQRLLESLPIHADQLDKELNLLDMLPQKHRNSRLSSLLKTDFEIHPIDGDGACGARSLAVGILDPWILEMRKTDLEGAKQREIAFTTKLRKEVADYMEENVKNLDEGKKNNSNGSEPFDYRSFCVGKPAPEGVGEKEGEEIKFDEYIKRIRDPKGWFGEQEMAAAARLYRTCIHIYTAGSVTVINGHLQPKKFWIQGEEFTNTKGPVSLFHSGNHYQIMTRRKIS